MFTITLVELDKHIEHLRLLKDFIWVGGFALIFWACYLTAIRLKKRKPKINPYIGTAIVALVLGTGWISLGLEVRGNLKEVVTEYIDKMPTETYEVKDIVIVSEIEKSKHTPDYAEPVYNYVAKIQYMKDGMKHVYEGEVDIRDTKGETFSFKYLEHNQGFYNQGYKRVTIK